MQPQSKKQINKSTTRENKKKPPLDEPTVPSVQALVHLVHCVVGKMKMTPSDDLMVLFLDVSDELQRRSNKVSSTG
jgi:hypothetical protein